MLASILLMLLSGCGTPQPVWIGSSFVQLEGMRSASLEGNDRKAERAFNQAAHTLRLNGQETAYARLWLHRQTLDFVLNRPLSEPASPDIWLALDPEGDALRRLLQNPFAVDPTELNKDHRTLLRALQQNDVRRISRQLNTLQDPFRQLLWVHILMRYSEVVSADSVDLGIAVARHQGWSKALHVLLEREALRTDALGDTARAAEMRRQLAFITGTIAETPGVPHQ